MVDVEMLTIGLWRTHTTQLQPEVSWRLMPLLMDTTIQLHMVRMDPTGVPALVLTMPGIELSPTSQLLFLFPTS